MLEEGEKQKKRKRKNPRKENLSGKLRCWEGRYSSPVRRTGEHQKQTLFLNEETFNNYHTGVTKKINPPV